MQHTLLLRTLRHICHSSAPFDSLITISLHQKKVGSLLRFRTAHSMAICYLVNPEVTLTLTEAQMLAAGVSCSSDVDYMTTAWLSTAS